MPYLRGGAIVPFGARDGVVEITPIDTTKSTGSFGGGKTFSSPGWVAGAGAEVGLIGAWSLSAEFLHASFGKASSTVGSCAGTAANCAPFSGVSFADAIEAPRANIIRLGFTYWFNYWDVL